MLKRVRYVQTFKDRHGESRTYYRHRNYRVALPHPDHDFFWAAYAEAKASDPFASGSAAVALRAGKPTSVYVIQGNGAVKIGMSERPETRAGSLQGGASSKLAIVITRTFEDRASAFAAERALHGQFADKRLRGEWFGIDASEAVQALLAA